MEVELLHYTPNGLELITKFARISGVPDNIPDEEIVKMVVERDYGSILEHIVFVFNLKNISVAISREILEHRVASHTARSTRYVEELESKYYEPEGLASHSEPEKVKKLFSSAIEQCHKAYRELRKQGVKREFARYVLPLATLTNYTWTINARSLINFLTLRQCVRAAPEIQELAREVYGIVVRIYPEIFESAKCRGYWLGVCPENKARPKNCYYPFIPTKEEVKQSWLTKK
ncbi:MAG: FAD-dependent thymidylate synthase [Euryarchaeota archaeon]|nr:FAD-dependent thymidylate synthase [Euryarchaeota archaeon]